MNSAPEVGGAFLDRDDDGHWYIVPRGKESEWDEWKQTEDAPLPVYAVAVCGTPRRVTIWEYTLG